MSQDKRSLDTVQSRRSLFVPRKDLSNHHSGDHPLENSRRVRQEDIKMDIKMVIIAQSAICTPQEIVGHSDSEAYAYFSD